MISPPREQKRQFFKMHKASYIMIIAAIIIGAFIFLSPVFSTSTSQCSACHGGYYQYLDILEGNTANQIPTSLTVGQTATVTVVVENNVNTVLYNALSSASFTLSSQNGHFTVSTPTYNIGTLQKGTATATWQITGVSAGPDTFVITATAKNLHQNLLFQDNYAPAPTITISILNPTPAPTSLPTAVPTPSPTSTNVTIPTTTPDFTSTSTSTPGQTTVTTTPTPTSTPITPTPTPNPKNELSINPNQQNTQNALSIWFTTPVEGATLTAGSKTIEWATSGGSGNSNIKLELSKLGSSGPWTTLAENLTSSDSFIWAIPDQQVDYRMRATASDYLNPTQTASVTVATKINSTLQTETISIISMTTIILLFALFAVFIVKKRVKQNGNRKEQKFVALNALHDSLYPSFLLRLIQFKVILGEIL
jgi:hypothetical protein